MDEDTVLAGIAIGVLGILGLMLLGTPLTANIGGTEVTFPLVGWIVFAAVAILVLWGAVRK